jgi:hypothetical protein
MHWAKATRALMFCLEESQMPLAASQYKAHALESLPMPAMHYIRNRPEWLALATSNSIK